MVDRMPVAGTLTPEQLAQVEERMNKVLDARLARLPSEQEIQRMVQREITGALTGYVTADKVGQMIAAAMATITTTIAATLARLEGQVGEVLELKETVAEIRGILTTWKSQRDEVLDQVRDDQKRIDDTHKLLSDTLGNIQHETQKQHVDLYGDPGSPDGPPSLLRRMAVVEGVKLDTAVFERMFMPVLSYVDDQRKRSEAQIVRQARRREMFGQLVDVLSVKRVGGLGAMIGAVVKLLADHL